MKIIAKPDVSDWLYPHTCEGCETQLEVEAKDLYYTHHDASFGDPAYDSYSAKCPICSKYFDVLKDKIPKLVKAELEMKNKTVKNSYQDR